MTKDGKYRKLTMDVPHLVEKHRLWQKKRGWCFLMKKLILILLILLVKDMIQKRNTLIYQKLYSKHKLTYQVLKIRSKKFKNIIKGGCIPTFNNDPEDLLSLLELIIGSIDAGNDNSKMKNRGMVLLDELLKLRAISEEQHEKLYIRYLI